MSSQQREMQQQLQQQMAMMQQMAMQQQMGGMNPQMQGQGYQGQPGSTSQMQQMQQMQSQLQMAAMMQQMAAMQQMGGGMQSQMAQTYPGLGQGQTAPSNGLNANAPEFDPSAMAKVAEVQKEETPEVGEKPVIKEVTVGLFLEEIAFFMEDMEKDLWWLLRMAHQPDGIGPYICGDEQVQQVDAAVEAAIQRLKERADKHAEDHVAQVRAKIVIIPAVDKVEREILNALRNLKFHCKGQIQVFPCIKEANNAAIWQAYFNCVSGMEPQWLMKSDGVGAKSVFARCAAIIPVYIDRNKKEIKIFNVWCPEKKKRHWAFLEGDILRGADRHIYDTCRRIFNSQVGHLFGKQWSGCFLSELPEIAGTELKEPSICTYVKLEQDGHRYPCRPHFFLQVTEDFYETTRCYEDASGVIKLPQPEGDFVKWDDLASARRVHLDGTFFMEHDEARWVIMEYETGKLMADDTRQLRKENGDLLRSQPEKLWKWLAERTGLAMVQRSSGLPEDFPEDGPFSVRMSGIDKTATDEDIEKYFEERDVKVKSVEQFDVPRHTARIDFHDKASLEVAIQLSGHNLLRRKVKVELWTDNDMGTSTVMGAKPLKPYVGPLPDEPPFKVIVKGLDKSVNQRDLGYFFWDRDCECKEVVYPLKNERQAGTVEFNDKESLRKALGLNSAVFKGREVTISMFNAKEDNRPAPAPRSSGPGGGGGGKSRGKGDDRGAGRSFRDDRGPPSRAEFGSERPRLELKPRSKPMPGDANYREDSPPRGAAFGSARPVNDRYKTTRADADDNWRR